MNEPTLVSSGNPGSRPRRRNYRNRANALAPEGIVSQLRALVSMAADIQLFKTRDLGVRAIRQLSDFQALPLSRRADYARLGSVEDAVVDPWIMSKPLAPFDLSSPTFPLTVLYSSEDLRALEERAGFMLRAMNVLPAQRVVVVTTPLNMYAAADLVELFIAAGYRTRAILLQDLASSSPLLHVTRPKVVVLAADPKRLMSKLPAWLPRSVRKVATFNQFTSFDIGVEHYDVWHLEEAPLIAVSENGRDYRSMRDHFFIESDVSKRIVLTTLRQRLMPLIRYETEVTGIHIHATTFTPSN